MILTELAVRAETPLELRIALLILLLVIGLFFVIIPQWVTMQYTLAAIPFQKFDWMSQGYTKNTLIRFSSIFCISVVYSIFACSYLNSQKITFFDNGSLNYLLILFVVIALTALKLFLNQVYFKFHNQDQLGEIIIDFQYSLNILFSILLSLVMVFDVFFLRMNAMLGYATAGILLLLFLTKLFGTILLIQNKHSYPIITVFIYLCTAEIVPMLVIAKVLFVNS